MEPGSVSPTGRAGGLLAWARVPRRPFESRWWLAFAGIPVLVTQLTWQLTAGNISSSWFLGWLVVTASVLTQALIGACAEFSLARFDLAAVFATGYAVMVLLGTPTIFAAQLDAEPTVAYTFLAATALAPVLTLAGLVAFRYLGSPRRRITVDRVTADSSVTRTALWALFVVCVGCLLLYLGVVGSVPLVGALRGDDPGSLLAQRQEALRELGESLPVYAFSFVRTYGFPFLAAATLVRFRSDRRLSTLLLLIGSIGLGLFTAMATLEKSPAARFVVVLAVAWYSSSRRIRIRSLVPVFIVALAFPYFATRATSGEGNTVGSLSSAIAKRVFISPAEVVYNYFEWAPRHSGGFLWGRSLPFVSKVAPGGTYDLPAAVYRFMFPDNAGLSGSANGAFHATAWAEGGWLGVVGTCLFLGCALAILQTLIDNISIPGLREGLLAVFASQAVVLNSTSIFDSILSGPFGALDLVLFVGVVAVVRSLHVRTVWRVDAPGGRRTPGHLPGTAVLGGS